MPRNAATIAITNKVPLRSQTLQQLPQLRMIAVAATGYDVAWKDPANGVYTVWSTDSAGNYTGNVVPVGPSNSTALESIETTFRQDLSGDGTIGIPTVLIQTDGTTSLAQVGDNFFLYAVGTTTGPELKYSGNGVTTGEFGAWTPIGAVQTAIGYDVAWHDPANGVYTVWTTDSAGNYTSNVVPVLPGNNSALESIENEALKTVFRKLMISGIRWKKR